MAKELQDQIANTKRSSKNLEIISQSFILPQEYEAFKSEFTKNGGIYIMKPEGTRQGRGIFLANKLSQVLRMNDDLFKNLKYYDSKELDRGIPTRYIAQKYIENPYLIGNRKFDLRCYVLVKSFNPLQAFIHTNGFCRFSNTPYSNHERDITNMCMLVVIT
jgi:tubulin polyglutamylase TTLL9